jgi:hypothetical protein
VEFEGVMKISFNREEGKTGAITVRKKNMM